MKTESGAPRQAARSSQPTVRPPLQGAQLSQPIVRPSLPDRGGESIIVDKKEIYRYLGYRGRLPDPEVIRLADSCLKELREAVTPRWTARRFPIERGSEADTGMNPKYGVNEGVLPEPVFKRNTGMSLTDSGHKGFLPEPIPEREARAGEDNEEETPVLRIAGMEIRSKSLARNLRGCGEAVLMAATLGLGPDRLIARASVKHMSRAVVLQAAAAAMIEAWCDEVNRRIREEAAEDGLCLRPRFSPGYGDFPLEFQEDFARILRLQKEIGVTLTGSRLMLPSKSVTAVIGLSKEKAGCVLHGCEECERAEDCAFSRTAGK